MYSAYRPLLDALQERGADAHALAGGRRRGRAHRTVDPRRPDQRPHRHRDGADRGARPTRTASTPSTWSATRSTPPRWRRSRSRWSCGTGCSASRFDDDELVVAVSDPGDVVALDDVRAVDRPADRARSSSPAASCARSSTGSSARRPTSTTWPTSLQRRARTTADVTALGAQRRRRADRPLRQLADRAGDPEPGLRPAPRADRARPAGALPHRRRAARGRHACPRGVQSAADLAG